jgi:hypothetical protein
MSPLLETLFRSALRRCGQGSERRRLVARSPCRNNTIKYRCASWAFNGLKGFRMLQDAPISEGHRIDLTSRAPGMTISRLGRDDQPLRAEFLSLDQLTRHAHTLANWHHLAARPRNDLLLPRLHENAAVLGETYEFINTTVQEGQTIVPAAIWLLDNYYVIDTHIRMTRRHLPRRYSLELPQLIGGPADGYPRVYDIAMELISHADGLLGDSDHAAVGAAGESAPDLDAHRLAAD